MCFAVVQKLIQPSSPTENATLLQTCRWRFLVFSGTFDVLLQVVTDEDSNSVTFFLDELAFFEELCHNMAGMLLPNIELYHIALPRHALKDVFGYACFDCGLLSMEACDVQVLPLNGSNGCDIIHEQAIELSLAPPPQFDSYTQAILEKQVADIMLDLAGGLETLRSI